MNIKNLKISEETHTKLKIHCAKNKLKLNDWVDELLKFNLENNILITLLEGYKDIEYMLKKYHLPETLKEELSKISKQIDLMADGQIIKCEVFLEKSNREAIKLKSNK